MTWRHASPQLAADDAAFPPPVMHGDDRVLVQRIRAGDEHVFEALYRASITPLTSFAHFYVRDRTVAEELAQDVLCTVWERRAQWDVEGTVRGYLFLAVRNRAFSWLRRRRVNAQWAQAASGGSAPNGMSEGPASPEQRVETEDLERALEAAIAELPERGRLAYTLRWHHQLSVKEVATVMGISFKGAEMAILRATRLVRQRLAPFAE